MCHAIILYQGLIYCKAVTLVVLLNRIYNNRPHNQTPHSFG